MPGAWWTAAGLGAGGPSPPGGPKAAQGAWRQGSGQGTSATEVGAPLGLCCGFPLRSRAGPLGLAPPLLEPHPVSPPCVSSRFLPPTPPLCRQAAPPPAPAPPFLQDQLLITAPRGPHPHPHQPWSRTSPVTHLPSPSHRSPPEPPLPGSHQGLLGPCAQPSRPSSPEARRHPCPRVLDHPPPTPRNQPLRFHSREAQLGHGPLLTAEGRGVPMEPGAPWEAHASSSSPLLSGSPQP